MRVLLAAVNAKYIHANLAVLYLREVTGDLPAETIIGEYTINMRKEEILEDIYRKHPDIICFSCYIWNRNMIAGLIRDLRRILPEVPIWAGGPDVTYEAESFLEQFPECTSVMVGEGERSFRGLIGACLRGEKDLSGIPGLVFRDEDGSIRRNAPAVPMAMDDLPFVYCPELDYGGKCSAEDHLSGGEPQHTEKTQRREQLQPIDQPQCMGKLQCREQPQRMTESEAPCRAQQGDGDWAFENRIIYYETSRGCPFSCSYCLSSVSDRTRFRSLSKVLPELQFFLDRKVPQVKFVDRTFNCSHEHAMAIWKYIAEHDNGITNFHFEIGADLLREDEMDVLAGLRPGAVQLEIGVQSVNPDTIRAIDRVMDLGILRRNVDRIHRAGNIHCHLDLIAGLPYEDLASFRHSFDEIFRMKPDQLQLGFLKLLKGSALCRDADKYGIVCSPEAPYEVLRTDWISYEDLLELRGVEEMTEVYYNSFQFSTSVTLLADVKGSPYEFFRALSEFYRENHLTGRAFSRIQRIDILREFAESWDPEEKGRYEELFLLDLYLRENSRRRPEWAKEALTAEAKEEVREFLRRQAALPEAERRLRGYEAYDSRQMEHMTHAETFTDPYVVRLLREAVKNGGFSRNVDENLKNVDKEEPLVDRITVLFDYRRRDPLNGNADVIRTDSPNDGRTAGAESRTDRRM
ncbi:DUF4080 domain-containing protein [[Clostridium] aminophilum]|uniref:B12-binding domain-containing radical SAM protein n=1 Tax=[Clostridium] aminophilum TaxID=1526 RepID=UPI003325B015